MSKKPIIGILGGIGSGKSTVARQFCCLGCAVIDADQLAYEVLTEPAVVTAIRQRFGAEIVDTEGRVDRRVLARRVFDNPADIEFLNGLVHPGVLRKSGELIQQLQADDSIAAIVFDMPLLMEVGWEKNCDFLIFVECEYAKRVKRVLKSGKMDEKQLKKRENFQISLDKKRKVAHYVVHNNSDESDITEQIAQVYLSITRSR